MRVWAVIFMVIGVLLIFVGLVSMAGVMSEGGTVFQSLEASLWVCAGLVIVVLACILRVLTSSLFTLPPREQRREVPPTGEVVRSSAWPPGRQQPPHP